MQVSIETTSGLERKMTITVSSEKFDKLVDDKLIREAKRVRLNGFRPGKVPKHVVEQKFGQEIRQEASQEVMQSHFFEAVVSEKIEPVSMPTFTLLSSEQTTQLKFDAVFEVFPEVSFEGIEKLEIEKLEAAIEHSDVDEMLLSLQKQHAKFSDVDRPCAEGDKIKIDFVGKVDGEAFEGGTATDFELTLGSSQMIPGFESGILNHGLKETFTIDVTFPEAYQAEHLQGKAAQFEITIQAIQASELPELDTAFCALFKASDEADLRAQIEKNMQQELDQALTKSFKDNAVAVLSEAYAFDVPQALIDSEIKHLMTRAKERFGQGQADFELPRDLFEEQAQQRVRASLLIDNLIKVKNIEVDDAAVEALIESYATSYEDPAQFVAESKKNNQTMQNARHMALENAAMDFLAETAKVVMKKTAFQELIQSARA